MNILKSSASNTYLGKTIAVFPTSTLSYTVVASTNIGQTKFKKMPNEQLMLVQNGKNTPVEVEATSSPRKTDIELAISEEETTILRAIINEHPELKIDATRVSHAPGVKSCIFIKCRSLKDISEDDFEAFSDLADRVYESAIPALQKSKFFGMVSIIY